MLRITDVTTDSGVGSLKLEGKLAGRWVDILERECQRFLAKGGTVELDFAAVRSVERQGIAMLRGFPPGSVRIINAEPFVLELLFHREEP